MIALAADGKISLIPKQKDSALWHSESIDEKTKSVVDVSKERLQNTAEELQQEYKKEQEKYINNKFVELNETYIIFTSCIREKR